MKRLDFGRNAFGIGLATVLAGCAGQGGTPGTVPQVAIRAQRLNNVSHTTRSWISPEANSNDLLYVSNVDGAVTIYFFPTGIYAGTLLNTNGPAGECVDKSGDVFITVHDRQEVLEYAHGGTKIARLSDSGYLPYSCSIDPVTGNLAVANYSNADFGPGSLAIYKDAKGPPQIHTTSNMSSYHYCAYDNNGNLFVNGYDGGDRRFILDELPKGSSTFEKITLSVTELKGGVQWHGKYLTVGDGDPNTMTMYQFAITGSHGSKIGSTTLIGGNTDVFWIQGSQVVAPYELTIAAIWNYPAGGNPTRGPIWRNVLVPRGLAVSLAASRSRIRK